MTTTDARPGAISDNLFVGINTETVAYYDSLQGKDAIIREMLRVPKGQAELSADTAEHLRYLTGRLLGSCVDYSVGEYGRYVGISERHVDIPEDAHRQIREKHEGKTVLVTGGTGQIGQALMAELSEFNPGRLISVTRGITPAPDTKADVQHLHADIVDSDKLQAAVDLAKPDIIYHLAAQKHPGIAEKEIRRTLTTNILGTNNVINAARNAGVPQVVYASTGKAMRPYSPDTYAASKKAGEWLASTAAQEGDLLVSSARFTHVADNSVFNRKLLDWIAEDRPIRLHDPDIMFYLQSSRESAQLLLAASIDAEPGTFNMLALNNLQYPVSLTDLAIGALAKTRGSSPIYYCGYEPGYEETPYHNLYDPRLAGDRSPLISGLEAHDATPSPNVPQIDSFPLTFGSADALVGHVDHMQSSGSSDAPEVMKANLDNLSWSLLDARLKSVPGEVLGHAAQQIKRQPFTVFDPDHRKTDEVVLSTALLVA